MSQTYQARRRAQTAPAEQKFETSVPGPSIQELAAGAMPSAEQMGRRVDLPDAIREKMEASFGADFSGVKLYESQTVADAGANAMTMGSNVAFAPGQLDLASTSGQALLGHELSHVVSQARGESVGRGFLADAGLEAQADRQGMLAAQGESAYSGPVAPLSSSAVPASAAGSMQARKAESAGTMTKDGFDELAQYSTKTGGYPYEEGMGTARARYGDGKFNFSADAQTRDESDFIRMPGGTLRGHVFRPTVKNNGKHVILYSGSGGQAANQVTKQVEQYNQEGYTVHVYDYRGFGRSSFSSVGVDASERSIMEDATAIYEHVLQNKPSAGTQGRFFGGQNTVQNTGQSAPQAIAPENVLIHGFSMGGVAASHVARHAAIRARRSGRASDKLGGLLLESSMRNFGNAAVSSMNMPGFLTPLAQAYSTAAVGGFDAETNLRETAELDPDLPVTFLTGSKEMDDPDAENDHLSEESTQLAHRVGGRFKNKQLKTFDNMGHTDQEKLTRAWEDIEEHLMRK